MNTIVLFAVLCAVAALAATVWAVIERGRAARADMRARLLEANAGTLTAQAAHSAQAVAEALVQRATESFQAQERVAQARMEEKLKPVAETLAKFEAHVTAAEKARAEETGGLKHQLAALLSATVATQEEARKLSTALRRGAGVQGRWGEHMLRNVLEMAGLKARVDFEEQVHVEVDGGGRRPDVVVRLPGGGVFVIDAKCSLNAFLEAQDAQDEAIRESCYLRHAQSMRSHVQSLAAKAYWDQFEASPDFVAMFVPGDAFLSAALERNPELMTEAMERHVILVTPSTLFALCKAVVYGWRVEKQALNAAETAALGRELYKRLSVMGGHVAGVGKALETAIGRYNQFVASFETQVLTQARRFEDLSSDHEGRSLPEPPTVDVGARPLTKLFSEPPERSAILTVKAPAPTSAA
jgi:DNA recombination protein RmuC